jgi:hypothetical protein
VFGKGIKGDEKAEMLRGLINAGHQRNLPYIRRDITTRALENSPTFAMAALATIGDLPDTIMDRAVVIRMRRRAPGEYVAPFRLRRDTPALHVLRSWLTEWAQPYLDELADAEPDTGLDDRGPRLLGTAVHHRRPCRRHLAGPGPPSGESAHRRFRAIGRV